MRIPVLNSLAGVLNFSIRRVFRAATDKIQIVLRTPILIPDSGFFNYGFFANYFNDMNFFAGGI